MMTMKRTIVMLSLALLAEVAAKVELAPVFGYGMVLQRGKEVPVWGSAGAGAEVTVSFAGQTVRGKADAEGEWMVRLQPLEASVEGRDLVVSDGGSEVRFGDVVVGEVWICAGQSNMRWPLSQATGGVPEGRSPLLRVKDDTGTLLPNPVSYSSEQLAGVTAENYYESSGWQRADGQGAGSFPAVGYWFGESLRGELGVPVGLIHNAIGGAPMEAYLPAEVLEERYPGLRENWLESDEMPAWAQSRGRQNLANWLEKKEGARPGHPFEPGFLFEAGMRPLAPFAARGVLWYQGESNATSDLNHRVPADSTRNEEMLAAMIAGWRGVWRDESLLVAYPTLPRIGNRGWAPFREAQQRVAERLKGVGTVDIFDHGATGDVHPRDKKPVGEVLCRLVLDGMDDGVVRCGFESVASGELSELASEAGQWKAEPVHATVTDKYAHAGRQALHLFGGEDRQVELHLKPGVQWGELSFRAERWTSRGPFVFRLEALSGGEWKEIHQADREVRVGARFLSQVRTSLPENCEAVRFRCTAHPGGGVLIDDVRVWPARPMRLSVRTEDFVHPALIGREENPLLRVKLETRGTLKPLSLTAVKLGLAGTSDLRDLKSLEVRIGGEIFGRTESITEEIVIQGNHELGAGDSVLEVVGSLSKNAKLGRRIRVGCLAVKAGEVVRDLATPYPAEPVRVGVALRQSGQDKCHTYRIPGLATTNRGTLIAVYDCRWRNGGDLPGDIDVGMSRSTDGGETWSRMQVIMDMGKDPKWHYDGIGDPAVLVDTVTNTIWVAATWSHGNRSWIGSGPGVEPEETGQLMIAKSEDDGKTWSKPINITKQVKDPEWRFVLQGPGKGITMKDGTLVFAAQFRGKNGEPVHGKPASTVITSRDRGQTWQIGTGVQLNTTEAQVVELGDGRLMLNCRDDRGGSRSIFTSADLGQSWTEHATSRKALPEPVCMASLIRLEHREHGPLLLFSNPAQTRGRQRMTIKVSSDEGMTWPEKWHSLLDEDVSMYSCLTPVGDDAVGLVYEGREGLHFLRVEIGELLGE